MAKMDKAYPELMWLVCSGDHKPTATLSAIKMGKTAQDYLKIELKEVFCTAANVSGSDGGSQVTVSYAFDANKIKWQYAPQKADGSLDPFVTKTWDLKMNKE
jgi:type VI secretion system secreted protein Hcp